MEREEFQKQVNERLIAVEHHISGVDGKNGMRGEIRELKQRSRWMETRIIGIMIFLAGGGKLLDHFLK